MNLTVKGRHRDTDLYPPVLASLTAAIHPRTPPPRSAVIPRQRHLDQGGGHRSLLASALRSFPARLGLTSRVGGRHGEKALTNHQGEHESRQQALEIRPKSTFKKQQINSDVL